MTLREYIGIAFVAVLGGMSSLWTYEHGKGLCRQYSWCPALLLLNNDSEANRSGGGALEERSCLSQSEADSIFLLSANDGGTTAEILLSDFQRRLAGAS